MVVIMIVVGVLVVALAVAVIWYVATRGTELETMTRAQFEEQYDEMVARGEIVAGDRDEAWRDFDAQQVSAERDRQFWQQAGDESP